MSEPLVCAVMLTKNRPQMAARAVRGFRSQAYERKKLIVIDTSPIPLDIDGPHVTILSNPTSEKTIGALRNTACTYASKGLAEQPDIIAHFDDDDWSHPNRLAEQVALLQAGEPAGVECVGYNECVFWDERNAEAGRQFATAHAPEMLDFYSSVGCSAWIYRYPNPAYALGTSLMYWRRAWERKPFDDINHGEDERFRLAHRTAGVSSLGESGSMVKMADVSVHGGPKMYTPILGTEPRLIVSIHAGNTSKFDPAANRATCKRVPEFDEYCREAMRL